MKCPECGGATRVRDSRPTEQGRTRRYQCDVCSSRFTTIEVLSHVGQSQGRDPLELRVHALRAETLDEIESEVAHLLGVLRRRYNVQEESTDVTEEA